MNKSFNLGRSWRRFFLVFSCVTAALCVFCASTDAAHLSVYMQPYGVDLSTQGALAVGEVVPVEIRGLASNVDVNGWVGTVTRGTNVVGVCTNLSMSTNGVAIASVDCATVEMASLFVGAGPLAERDVALTFCEQIDASGDYRLIASGSAVVRNNPLSAGAVDAFAPTGEHLWNSAIFASMRDWVASYVSTNTEHIGAGVVSLNGAGGQIRLVEGDNIEIDVDGYDITIGALFDIPDDIATTEYVDAALSNAVIGIDSSSNGLTRIWGGKHQVLPETNAIIDFTRRDLIGEWRINGQDICGYRMMTNYVSSYVQTNAGGTVNLEAGDGITISTNSATEAIVISSQAFIPSNVATMDWADQRFLSTNTSVFGQSANSADFGPNAKYASFGYLANTSEVYATAITLGGVRQTNWPSGGGGSAWQPTSRVISSPTYTIAADDCLVWLDSEAAQTNQVVTLPDLAVDGQIVTIRHLGGDFPATIHRGTSTYTLQGDGAALTCDWLAAKTNWYWRTAW